MQTQDDSKLIESINALLENSRAIYALCNENINKSENFSKVDELFADNQRCIEVISSIKEHNHNYTQLLKENSDSVQEILKLNANIVKFASDRKDEIARKLSKINTNKNLLIYK